MSLGEKQAPKPKRRWFQFRLRTLLVMVALAAGAFRWLDLWINRELDQRRREKATIAWIEGMSGSLFFDGNEYDGYGQISWWLKTKDTWFGPRVATVVLSQEEVSDISPLKELKSLEQIYLSGTSVTDLTPLAGFEGLWVLSIEDSKISDLSTLAGMNNVERLFLSET